MNRIQKKFKTLKEKKQKALIVFITAGDPSLKKTEELVLAFEKDGVDFVELGVPFSDPLADGPVIQESSTRSLANKTTLSKILHTAEAIRKKSDIPLLLMGYLNPFLSFGYERFAREAKKAGIDGVIVPDLPPDDEHDFVRAVGSQGIDIVYLLAPTSTPARTQKITHLSKGFVYYVSMTGVTGSGAKLSENVFSKVAIAQKTSKNPICVGFGISTPEQAKTVSENSDGVIVGSALVKALFQNQKLSAEAFSRQFVRPFARALGKA